MRLRTLLPSIALLCALTPSFAFAQSDSSGQTHDYAHASSAASVPVAPDASSAPAMRLISERIVEARQLLKSRAATPTDYVTLAAFDSEAGRIHLLPIEKEVFLQRGAHMTVLTSLGHTVNVNIVRANGVNTAVSLFDTETGRTLLPLVVEYPITKNGASEMAYYTSAHPAILSQETVANGSSYVRTTLDRAAANLAVQGVEISSAIVDIAEHLCIVEHTDHKRFLNENRQALFHEILSLYALNQPDTYRYSVSSAGAGGMVQMIPSTYEMVRRLHPNVRLHTDFVTGMRDHANALTAMLLYMQDTWDNLRRSPEVQYALGAGLATQAELVAAGYNSNPVRLPLYIRRGGADWRTLIPSETQMYLQIYASLDHNVAIEPRQQTQTIVAAHKSLLLSPVLSLMLF